jgi:hypothetical protein
MSEKRVCLMVDVIFVEVTKNLSLLDGCVLCRMHEMNVHCKLLWLCMEFSKTILLHMEN